MKDLLHAKGKDAMAGVGFSGPEHGRRPVGLVGRVGVVLGFQADGAAERIGDAFFAHE